MMTTHFTTQAGLREHFGTIKEFLGDNQALAPKRPGKAYDHDYYFGTSGYWEWLAKKFEDGRAPRSPKPPATVSDPLVSVILNTYFDVDEDGLDQAARQHSLSMQAENVIGAVLERYIAEHLEPTGWIWCSGEVVKKVDFVRRSVASPDRWQALQIKNRDNSENSASKAIRDGTQILKWHRSESRSGKTNWEKFPVEGTENPLSEVDFVDFTQRYLMELRID